MSRINSLQICQQPGILPIGFGLSIVLTTQIFSAVPLAAAMMLIGWGTTQILATGNFRSPMLMVANLVVYAFLGCFAIAAQSHAAIHGPINQIGLLLWLDHGVAILLLVAAAKQAFVHVDTPVA